MNKNNKINCQIHNDFIYTHFCLCSGCLTPLCSECLVSHQEFHNQNQSEIRVEGLNEVKMRCRQKIDKTFLKLSGKMQNFLLNNHLISAQSIYDEGLQKIETNKKKLLDSINIFFDELTIKFKTSLNILMDFEIESTTIFEKIQRVINKLQYYQVSLDGKNPHQTLKKICLLDVRNIISKCNSDLSNLGKLGEQENLSIQTKEEFLKEIDKNLQNFIFFSKEKSNFNELNIKTKDFLFEKLENKCLPYFMPNTKNLYLFDIENNQINKNFGQINEKIELKIDFQIPEQHESILTNNGSVYMIRNTDILEFNYNLKNLNLKNKLSVLRDHPSISFDHEHIYIFGGILNEDKKCVSICEKFNFKNSKISNLSALPIALCSGTVSLFKDKYIYYFGGLKENYEDFDKILRYDIKNDFWKEIDPIIHFKGDLRDFSLGYHKKAIQINKQFIFLFGNKTNNVVGVNPAKINHWNFIFSTKRKKLENSETDKSEITKIKDYSFYGNPVIANNNIFILGIKKNKEKDEFPQVFCLDSLEKPWLINQSINSLI